MTSNHVSKLFDSFQATQSPGMPGTKKTQNTESAFSMLLNPQTNSGKEQSAAQLIDSSAKKDSASAKPIQVSKDVNITKSDSNQQYKKLADKVTDKTEDYADKVTDVLTEKLGITEEELAKAMETLNLSFMDLTDPANLANLVMELTGAEDASVLLFSEEFQMLLADCGELTQSLLQELGITQEELDGLLAQMNQKSGSKDSLPEAGMNEIPEFSETLDQSLNDTNTTVDKESVVNQGLIVEEEGDPKLAVQEEGAQEQNRVTDGEEPLNTKAAADNEADAQTLENTADETEVVPKRQTGQESSAKEDGKGQNPQMTYQNVQTTTNVTGAGQEVTQVFQQSYVDADNIMRQVLEFTRIQVNPMESSIEMQLNPAHLGKILLQVVSRDGIITAQLAAQEEAVKNVLESQAAVLKESLNQQGLKVEAVEVTIASHEFEQNLENGQSTGERQAGEQQGKNRRNLTADSLDELEGRMSEEENLAAKIMLEQGNSMDMTA